MFGFLKKKLKSAISSFSKKAEEEVIEEKVEDEESIKEAIQDEKKIEEELDVVEAIPETPAEEIQHARESSTKSRTKETAEEIIGEGVKERSKEISEDRSKEKIKEKIDRKTKRGSEGNERKILVDNVEDGGREKVLPKKEEYEPPEKESEKEAETKKEIETKKEAEIEKEKNEEKEFVEVERGLEKSSEINPKISPVQTPKRKKFFKKFFGKADREVSKAEKSVVPVVEEGIGESSDKVLVPSQKDIKVERPVLQDKEEVKKPRRGVFSKIKESFTKKTLSENKFEDLFWELEVTLLENNVAVEVIEKLKQDLKKELTSGKVSRLGIQDLILLTLRRSIEEVLSIEGFDLVKRVKSSKRKPYVIVFVGVNGSGKTTTLAKIANLLQEEGLSVVIAASDTFRAAAIDQLKEHADKLGIKLISQGYGADPAAVAFDAIEHAKAKGVDVVMIDTAGRLHNNANLMAELEKVIRVAKPDLRIFIGESVTGNDCVEQAKEFNRVAGIDAVILSKADVDEKGGAALSVSYVIKKPILYLGVGQTYGDLKRFDKERIVNSLGL